MGTLTTKDQDGERMTIPRFTVDKVQGLMFYLRSIAGEGDDISKFLLELAPSEDAKRRMQALLEEKKRDFTVDPFDPHPREDYWVPSQRPNERSTETGR